MSLYKYFFPKQNHFIEQRNSIHRFISFWIQFMNIVWKEMNNFLLMDETIWKEYECSYVRWFYISQLHFAIFLPFQIERSSVSEFNSLEFEHLTYQREISFQSSWILSMIKRCFLHTPHYWIMSSGKYCKKILLEA